MLPSSPEAANRPLRRDDRSETGGIGIGCYEPSEIDTVLFVTPRHEGHGSELYAILRCLDYISYDEQENEKTYHHN